MNRRAVTIPLLSLGAIALVAAAPACDDKQAPEAAKAAAAGKAGPARVEASTPEPEAAKAPEAAKKPAADGPAAAATAPAATTTTAEVGKPAPDFTLKDLDGKEHKLSGYAGKTVVLEWYNPDCPFVVHAHKEGLLKEMAKQEMARGVVWLAINSGAPGKQGHGVERNKKSVQEYSLVNPVLIDEDGQVGKAYGAKTTPHMVVVDAKGVLRYAGGLSNAPLGRIPAGEELKGYVAMALADLAAGKDVAIRTSKPWGCSVKYAN